MQEKLLKDQLQSQQADLKQQLDREKELVRHSKQEADQLREKCQVLSLERNRAIHKIQKMRTASVGYKALHDELSQELNHRYVINSLSGILKK